MKTLREFWEPIREWWLEFQQMDGTLPEAGKCPACGQSENVSRVEKYPTCGAPIVLGIVFAILSMSTGCTMVNSHDDSDFHETARLWMQSRHTTTTKVTTTR
jgi:hypothetical protein